MITSKVVLLLVALLAQSLVSCSPTAHENERAIQLLQRDDINLPMFTRFSSADDEKQKKRLIQAFTDAIAMLKFILHPPDGRSSPLPDRGLIVPYFARNGPRGKDSSITLHDLAQRMVDASTPSFAAAKLSNIRLLSLTKPNPALTDPPEPGFLDKCGNPDIFVHAESGKKTRPYMRFCPQAFNAPDLSTLKCAKNRKISYEMFSLASVAIQAMVYTELICNSAYNVAPSDWFIPDGVPGGTNGGKLASGPLFVREFKTGYGEATVTLQNANSLAWYYTDIYWVAYCNTGGNVAPTTNDQFPPAKKWYKPFS